MAESSAFPSLLGKSRFGRPASNHAIGWKRNQGEKSSFVIVLSTRIIETIIRFPCYILPCTQISSKQGLRFLPKFALTFSAPSLIISFCDKDWDDASRAALPLRSHFPVPGRSRAGCDRAETHPLRRQGSSHHKDWRYPC